RALYSQLNLICIKPSSNPLQNLPKNKIIDFAPLTPMQLNNVKWEVQNYGVPGYTIHQGWIVLNDYALQYNPDYVFILFGINDSRPSPVSDAEYKVNIISFEKYLQKLFSYKLLMSFYFKALERQKMRGFDTVRVPLDKYEEFIIEFNNNSKKNRFVFIPMTQPYRQEFANTPFAQNIKKYNQALRNVCLQNNIEFIDLENEFNNYYLKNKRDLIWDACHPDAEGNIFISELMFEKIKAIDQKARN
ncbi:MAG TPA: SGNH/GDSL hydrolase family protein, partial [bacterium]|nr:SGNH/GDSL hydrolase family protein [bacterium]